MAAPRKLPKTRFVVSWLNYLSKQGWGARNQIHSRNCLSFSDHIDNFPKMILWTVLFPYQRSFQLLPNCTNWKARIINDYISFLTTNLFYYRKLSNLMFWCQSLGKWLRLCDNDYFSQFHCKLSWKWIIALLFPKMATRTFYPIIFKVVATVCQSNRGG